MTLLWGSLVEVFRPHKYFFLALEIYTTSFNEGIDKKKKMKKNRMVTTKDTTFTTHSSVAHTYYIMSHQELDETSWLIFI